MIAGVVNGLLIVKAGRDAFVLLAERQKHFVEEQQVKAMKKRLEEAEQIDILKGKKIMIWTFMGNSRMYQALRDYSGRISQVGLFSFQVRATGVIYESGVEIFNMLTYINKPATRSRWIITPITSNPARNGNSQASIRKCKPLN